MTSRFRCSACGNLTRFDVVASRRTRAFHHFSVGGELSVEEGIANGVPEVRTAFERMKQVEYSISSISGKDLEISKENDRIVVLFAYQREIHLAGPAYLTLKYSGRSK